MTPTATVCNYAMLRFVPYPERGESVNVGVLVNCQEPCLLEFRIEAGMPERVRAMFPQQDPGMFAAKAEWMREEVERVKAGITDPKRGRIAFHELIRPRESSLRFGEPRTILSDAPEQLAEELFHRYVRMEERVPRDARRRVG
jgi:hypothetical protein